MNIEALKLELMGLPPGTELTKDQKYYGIEFNTKSATMISYDRLTNLELLIEDIVKSKIKGDLIETGAWRGGACIFMSKMITHLNGRQKILVADSFNGLPKPDSKYPHDKDDYLHAIDYLSVPMEEVQANFDRFGCSQNYKFVKGLFKDTLHLLKNKFSLIRLDGDMYESTINALDALYPKLSIGGYCIIDDYKGTPNCPFAVDDYRAEHKIKDKMIRVDSTAFYWQKTK